MNNWKSDFKNKCEDGHFKIGEIDKSLLVNFITKLLEEQRKELINQILSEAPEDKHSQLTNNITDSEEYWNRCNAQWKELLTNKLK